MRPSIDGRVDRGGSSGERRIFGILCIALDAFTVSRAVSASSGVPVLFNSIVINNHAGTCGNAPPRWLHEAASREDKDAIRRVNARAYLKLADDSNLLGVDPEGWKCDKISYSG